MRFKSIKSLFVVSDETEKPAEHDEPTLPTEPAPKNAFVKVDQAPAPPATPTPFAPMPISGGGQVKKEFSEVLFKAMEKVNHEGFDYLEYRQSLLSLETMIADETTRYLSAFAMAKTMGVTKENLLKTADHYLAALQKEEQTFQQVVEQQRQKQIGNREAQLASFEKAIAEKTAMIQKLSEEIGQHRVDMENLRGQIQQAATTVEATQNDFHASYQALVKQIRQDMDNIQKHVPG